MRTSARRRRLAWAAYLIALAGTIGLFNAAPGFAATYAPLRPLHSLSHLVLRYETPLSFPNGALATAAPLSNAIIKAAHADFDYLHYETVGDLGGFEPAPIGKYLTGTTGHAVGNGPRIPHVPFLGAAGHGTKVYGFIHGLGPTTTTIPSGPTTTTIPSGATTTTTVPRGTSTTTPTSPQRPPLYIDMTNNHNHHPVLNARNMEPGSTASETVVIGNHGKVPFVVRLRSVGSTNALAKTLRLTVAVVGGRVLYSGKISTRGVRIGYLPIGHSFDLRISLHLPRSAGNSFQLKQAKLDLYWTGQG
jgi:hypothetical protein